jgi:chromosome segregation ATPase
MPNEIVYTTIEKSATNPSLENASYSTKGKKEWTHLERLERERKSLNQLYNFHQEQIVKLETRKKELMEQVKSLESSMKKLT